MRALITAAAFTLCSMSAGAQTLTARVVSVADGDTINVSTEDKRRVTIRLQGIDAPERTMPYSQVSRRHLSDRVINEPVTFDAEKFEAEDDIRKGERRVFNWLRHANRAAEPLSMDADWRSEAEHRVGVAMLNFHSATGIETESMRRFSSRARPANEWRYEDL